MQKYKIRNLCLLLSAVLSAGCGFFGEVERIGFSQTSGNMSPTIVAGEFFGCTAGFLSDFDFKSRIKRGSVVVVAIPVEQIPETGDIKPVLRRGSDGKNAPPAVPGHGEFVYRIVGAGGDRVKITKGRVYVNDALFEKIPENPATSVIADFPELLVPTGEYFLLNDNLGKSFDSRFWTNKTLSADKIVCEASYVVDDMHRSRPL